MLRLVQGDSLRKTVVAALAALQAVECGGQVALMARPNYSPTASRNFQAWWSRSYRGVLLTAAARARRASAWSPVSPPGSRRRGGHHALFQEDVRFHELSL